MKKTTSVAAAMLCLLVSSCAPMGGGQQAGANGTGILGGILSSATNGKTIANVITSVIGFDKLSATELVGTWQYAEPGCAFTSSNLLSKAGGEVVAAQIREKLATTYTKIGISKSNTQMTFAKDGTFKATVAGKSFSGTYTYDPATSAINLKSLLLNLNGYVKRSGAGISVLFESKKILTLMQTMAAMSGNATLGTIGEMSKNYDGVRVGFDMAR